jgi:hydroxyacylglutathione hydrolase
MMYISLITFLLPLFCVAKLNPGTLPKSFVEPAHNPPLWQVHAYNNNTYILRQSAVTDYEKPFLYLLFGDEKAYLFDTGSLYVLHELIASFFY